MVDTRTARGRRWQGLRGAAAMAAILALALPARAEAPPVPLIPVAAGPQAAPDAPAVMRLPPGWLPGDAAVVLVADADWPALQRGRLAALLMEAGAAVLEIRREATPPLLGGALRALHEVFGVGFAVAIGRGAGGEAALAAGAEAETPEGRRYAAAIRLGPGAAAFQPGEVPDGEGWALRAPILCDLLAGAQGAPRPEVAAACRRSLVRMR